MKLLACYFDGFQYIYPIYRASKLEWLMENKLTYMYNDFFIDKS